MDRWRRLGNLGWLAGGLGLVFVAAAVLTPVAADAADTTPIRIAFQGRMTDAAGVPVDGNRDMTFRYYDAAAGGTLLYAESRTGVNAVTVTQGNYAVALGAGTRTGGTEANFSGVFGNHAVVYLELQVAVEAVMTPRLRVLAAPWATSAELLDGLDAPSLVLKSGDTFTGALTVQGTLSWGTAGTRTETRDDAGAMGGQSGYYETATATTGENWPVTTNDWWHLLDVRHSNTANNYAMQFAGSLFDQNLYFRKTNNNAAQTWRRLAGPGSIVNVVTVQTRTIATFTAPISGDGTAITPLTLVLTPQQAGNKILLEWMVNGEFASGWNAVYMVTRNGVRLADTTDGANNRWAGITAGPYDGMGDNNSTLENPVVKIIDMNSLAVASTYELRVRSSDGTVETLYLNRCVGGAAQGQDSYETSLSVGVATEIRQ